MVSPGVPGSWMLICTGFAGLFSAFISPLSGVKQITFGSKLCKCTWENEMVLNGAL